MTNRIKIFPEILFAFTLMVGFSGCVTTRIIRYEITVREPKPSHYPMEIIDPANIGNRSYKVIGIVQVNAGKLHSTSDTMEHMKDAAREMGGDALIDFHYGPAQGGIIEPVGDAYVYGNVREIWSAKVIVWEQH